MGSQGSKQSPQGGQPQQRTQAISNHHQPPQQQQQHQQTLPSPPPPEPNTIPNVIIPIDEVYATMLRCPRLLQKLQHEEIFDSPSYRKETEAFVYLLCDEKFYMQYGPKAKDALRCPSDVASRYVRDSVKQRVIEILGNLHAKKSSKASNPSKIPSGGSGSSVLAPLPHEMQSSTLLLPYGDEGTILPRPIPPSAYETLPSSVMIHPRSSATDDINTSQPNSTLIRCGQCGSTNDVTYDCQECDEFYCNTCFPIAHSKGLKKQHTLVRKVSGDVRERQRTYAHEREIIVEKQKVLMKTAKEMEWRHRFDVECLENLQKYKERREAEED
eukprot:PhF_6_TR37226/c1_g1_i5/m.54920